MGLQDQQRIENRRSQKPLPPGFTSRAFTPLKTMH